MRGSYRSSAQHPDLGHDLSQIKENDALEDVGDEDVRMGSERKQKFLSGSG
jgi:hypothetical protein